MSNPSSGKSDSSSLQTYDDVKEYYGKCLSDTKDLKTSACAAPTKPLPKHLRDALQDIHEDVSSRYYGCGLSAPEYLENCSILDLGSGSGRDCYMLSKLVGENGRVTGIDMTEEQVEVSSRYIDHHTKKFGYQQPNVNFVIGYIENLKSADLQDGSFDIIISNCVINLSPDKRAVLREAYRVLKDGGEMYFSDMYINKPLSPELKKNKVLWGEGIGGALLWKDLFQIAEEIGFTIPRLVTARYISVNTELESLVGDYKCVSATFRLFKLPRDAVKENNVVIYSGGITGCEKEMPFDANFTLKEGEPVEVDEELNAILKNSRFAQKFLFPSQDERSSPGSCHIPKNITQDPFELAEKLSRENRKPGPECCSGPKTCS